MFRKLVQLILPLTAALLLTVFAPLNAAAEGFPFYEEETFYTQEETTPATEWQPTEPPTEAPTEAPEEPVWTVAPYEYEEDYESPVDEYAQLLDDAEEPTGINSIKMDKSVSNKTYSTDYTAGIVSWICVGVGLVVIMVMLVSTKLSGRSV